MDGVVKQQIGQFVGCFVAFALALFLPAGTLAWRAGWIFLALFFGFYLAVTLWLARHNLELLRERMRLRTPDQQGVALLARRATLEERTLRTELPGYAAYMTQVKYRLIPYVW